MRIGVIGTGGMARSRIQQLLSMGGHEIVWGCSRDAQRGRDFLAEFENKAVQGASTYSRWEEAVGDSNTDGIVVATPNTLHYPMAKAALLQGKHVLLEYPPTTSYQEGQELFDIAQRQRLVLYTGLTHRFSAMHKQLEAYLAPDGGHPVGKPLGYQHLICSGNPISRWYDKDHLSGGMFIASLYHFIDEALALLGGTRGVYATYHADRNEHGQITQDIGSIALSFECDCVAHITYARGFPKPGLGNSKTILCERGYLNVSGGALRIIRDTGEEILKPQGASSILLDTQRFITEIETGDTANRSTQAALAGVRIADVAKAQITGSGKYP